MAFTKIYHDNGSRLYVAGMAASSIARNRYAVSVHDDCGSEVAWAQSSRTGKWYPCEVAEYSTEGGRRRHRAMPYQPHTCPEPAPVAVGPRNVEGQMAAIESLREAASGLESDDPEAAATLRDKADEWQTSL